ncbi:pilus assembly protein [Lentzea tibetensis]|uniref:Pilus assembly protein n=1 Tax=Lentzea tibetensis TaxID=2591470 RepID=A0A563EV10_9PSEU|nr:TadE family protein [Lentzea tibetensis]TWP51331.1 pilus assembly protein [Lentzea tibetensis]
MVRLSPSDRGAAAVEFALVVPVLVAFLLGIVELARVFMADQDVATASREGARYALSAKRFGDCAGVRAAATRLAARSGGSELTVTIDYDHGPGTATYASCPVQTVGSADRIVITVSGTVSPIVPLFDPVTVSSTTRRSVGA